jgi:hypothetical protein
MSCQPGPGWLILILVIRAALFRICYSARATARGLRSQAPIPRLNAVAQSVRGVKPESHGVLVSLTGFKTSSMCSLLTRAHRNSLGLG